jgi:hypothetical protein
MAALRIFSVALIGKQSQPLYVRGFTSSNDLKWHWIAHCSLDYFEERGARAEQSCCGETASSGIHRRRRDKSGGPLPRDAVLARRVRRVRPPFVPHNAT